MCVVVCGRSGVRQVGRALQHGGAPGLMTAGRGVDRGVGPWQPTSGTHGSLVSQSVIAPLCARAPGGAVPCTDTAQQLSSISESRRSRPASALYHGLRRRVRVCASARQGERCTVTRQAARWGSRLGPLADDVSQRPGHLRGTHPDIHDPPLTGGPLARLTPTPSCDAKDLRGGGPRLLVDRQGGIVPLGSVHTSKRTREAYHDGSC